MHDVAFEFSSSLGIMHLKFVLPVSAVSSSVWLNDTPLYGYTGMFSHLPVEGQLGYLQFLVIVNKALVNINIQIFVNFVSSPLEMRLLSYMVSV